MGFRDCREWIDTLEREGELRRIGAEVDWNKEMGAVTNAAWRKGFSGLLFENIKDHHDTACRKLFTGGLVHDSQVALMFGLPKDTAMSTLVQVCRQRMNEPIQPTEVAWGPVKENIVQGDAVDLDQIPVPIWNRLDDSRYINTACGVVTRDPESGVHNVGLYRGDILDKRRIAQTIVPSQHIGQHLAEYAKRGAEMPVALVYGWDPSLVFAASAAVPRNVCEYNVMGGIRQEPVELVTCETSDLRVPATAEIVIEGFVSADPSTFDWQGEFGEFTGYYASGKTLKPVIRVECITHRHDPIFVGTLGGSLPGLPSEAATMIKIHRTAMVWDALARAGMTGLLDVHILPPSHETTVVLKMKKAYNGHSKQMALALLGSNLPAPTCKNVILVDEDIDIYDFESLVWALDYRVDPENGDIVTIPGLLSAEVYPNIRPEMKDMQRFGGVAASKIIVDATRTWSYGRRDEWGGDFYPPVAFRLTEEDEALLSRRWSEYGLD